MRSGGLLAILAFARYVNTYATNLADEDYTTQGASTACNATLNTGVDCPITILTPPNSRYYTSNELALLCASTCTNSLNSYVKSIASSCGSFAMVDAISELAFEPQIIGEYYLYGQLLACQKDTVGDYCSQNNTIPEVIISDGPLPTTTSNSKRGYFSRWARAIDDISSPCSECDILNLQAQLDSSFGYNDGKVSLYASLTSSCGSTNYPYTSPTPLAINGTGTSTSTTSTPTCAGTTYNIQSTDTCESISIAQKISTYNLVSSNGLVGSCVGFPTGGSLCIPSLGKCNVHTVTAEDTCVSMADQYNITITQLLSWNFQFNPQCTNLNQSVGYSVCVSSPRPFVLANVTDPGAGALATYASTALPIPTDIGPGVNPDCGNYYEVQTGDDCALIYQKFAISQSDFLFLNKAIMPNCTNLWANYSYCVLPVGDIYTYPGYPGGISVLTITGTPVDWSSLPTTNITEVIPIAYYTPAPLANGTRIDCIYDFTAYAVSNCADMTNYFGVTMEQFLTWNPSLSNSSDCRLSNGTRYCGRLYDYSSANTTTSTSYIAITPGPTPSNVVAGCQKWWLVQTNNTCALILEENDITLANFYAWNPSVGPQCGNLWQNEAYCVYGPNYNGIGPAASAESKLPWATAITFPSSGGTTGGGTPTVSIPGPTRTGTTASCTEFYLVTTSDTCVAILAKFGITIAEFYAWNPTVGSDCSGMWQNEAYCVAAGSLPTSTGKPTSTTLSSTTNPNAPPAPTQSGIVANCNKWVVSNASDPSCYDMAAAAGITLAQFYAWNPALKGDCSGLWANEAYCIGVKS